MIPAYLLLTIVVAAAPAAPFRPKLPETGLDTRLTIQAHSIVQLAAAEKTGVITPQVRQVAPITLSVAPSPVSLMENQSQQFTATLTGTINTNVTWTISPLVGSITSSGTYTAPAVISSAQTITVTATSAADTTKSTMATVNLVPVAVSLAPGPVTLQAAQTQQFSATVSGSSNVAVTWSINPAVGTINNGLYTAPASIPSAQTVTVTATSAADGTESASAAVSLQPTVGVTLSPTTVSLKASQTQQFTPTVTGSSNSGVTWTLNPAVGTISNGLYTAPSFISSAQTITVTATSVADTTKSGSAQVSLQATVAVSLTPTSTSLNASQTQQFTASVTGSSNQSVTWSLSPSVGTISSSGLYTAPGAISSPQQVTVMATSVADNTKSGQVTVTLNPPSGPSAITMPIEVMGPNGTTVSKTVNAPSVPSGTNTMQLRIHGLKYDSEASVQVNGSAWVPLNTATVTLLGNATAYGGIGGGFSTLDMTAPIPSGAIVAGNNTINFRFNATDGRTSGFRVLSFNFLDPNGNSLVPSSAFAQDDPTTWQPPSTNPTDIAAGQTLWRGAALTVPQSTGPLPIQARCTNCHAQDGRDLKYFNYSNYSIIARSVFHGLTAQQGAQIASYIRSLSVNNPGRPWNPPYQPGPGLDSLPVNQWSAGAGLSALATNDQDQFNDVFPGGIQATAFSPTGTINQRQIRVPFQMMDWNEWLPGVHPMDAFGATFTNSTYNSIYQQLRANLKVGDGTTYAAQSGLFVSWGDARQSFWDIVDANRNVSGFWTPSSTEAIYSVPLWGLVKNWEINNEFQLEGLSQAYYGASADPRSWTGNFAFMSSPNIGAIPATYLKNGRKATHDYLAMVWYHLQLILNDSNRHQSASTPIDWGYVYGAISTMGALVSPTGSLHYEWLIRGLQEENGKTPDGATTGWQWWVSNPFFLIEPGSNTWIGVPQATRVALANDYLTSWLSVLTTFTPQQFYKGGWATANDIPAHGLPNAQSGRFIDALWYTIPQLRYLGVNQTIINQLAAFGQSVWPNANFAQTATASCWIQGNIPVCSTEQ